MPSLSLSRSRAIVRRVARPRRGRVGAAASPRCVDGRNPSDYPRGAPRGGAATRPPRNIHVAARGGAATRPRRRRRHPLGDRAASPSTRPRNIRVAPRGGAATRPRTIRNRDISARPPRREERRERDEPHRVVRLDEPLLDAEEEDVGGRLQRDGLEPRERRDPLGHRRAVRVDLGGRRVRALDGPAGAGWSWTRRGGVRPPRRREAAAVARRRPRERTDGPAPRFRGRGRAEAHRARTGRATRGRVASWPRRRRDLSRTDEPRGGLAPRGGARPPRTAPRRRRGRGPTRPALGPRGPRVNRVSAAVAPRSRGRTSPAEARGGRGRPRGWSPTRPALGPRGPRVNRVPQPRRRRGPGTIPVWAAPVQRGSGSRRTPLAAVPRGWGGSSETREGRRRRCERNPVRARRIGPAPRRVGSNRDRLKFWSAGGAGRARPGKTDGGVVNGIRLTPRESARLDRHLCPNLFIVALLSRERRSCPTRPRRAVIFDSGPRLPTRASHFIGFSRKGCRGEPSSTVNRKFSGVGTRTVTRRELVRPCASSPWA